MCNFARNALKNYAEKVAPLDAVSLQRTIAPTDILLKAFVDAKLEDRTKELALSTDASLTGLGFTLGQAKDQFRHVPTAQLTESQLDVIRYAAPSCCNLFIADRRVSVIPRTTALLNQVLESRR
jgi:hypothetical protein